MLLLKNPTCLLKSLMLALFRIVECANGSSVWIDGKNIASVGLEDLRSSITIVPQGKVYIIYMYILIG